MKRFPALAHHASAVLLFAWLCAGQNLQAQENPFASIQATDTLALTIPDAIFVALENNSTVTIQKLAPKISQSLADEQRASFDPVLTGSYNKSESKSQRFLGSRPDPFELTTYRDQYSAQISERLPTGTTIAFSSSFSGTTSSIYKDQYVGSMGVTFSQSLLQGFGFAANLAALRRARLDVEMSMSELKGIAEQVVADVETAYWTLYLTGQEIEIQQASMALARQQLAESLERVAVGKLPELELAAVHAEVSTRNELLLDAQSRYEQARLRFLYLVNPNRSNDWATLPKLVDAPILPVDSLGAVDLHEALALKYRPDLQQAVLSMQKGDLELSQTRNGLLPRLDVFISFGRTAYAQTYNEGRPDIHSPFYDASAGVNLEFPVLNRQARAQVARARWSREQLVLSVENMKRLVQWDVRAAYIEVLKTKKMIETTLVTAELQEKKLAAELEKFRVGKSTNFQVLQAQRDFTSSRLDKARSVVAYLNALITLYRMEGTLLERRGIANSAF
jgi:outer membrane protein TolC